MWLIYFALIGFTSVCGYQGLAVLVEDEPLTPGHALIVPAELHGSIPESGCTTR